MTGIVTTQFNSLPNGPSANGNAMASIEFDLVADEIVSIDVNNGAPGQGLSRIESLYVDNTRGSGYLFFVFNDVKRLLIVPPGAEGCYATYSAASYFRVGQAKSVNGVHVRCKAFACTKHSFERFPGAGGLLQDPLDFNNQMGGAAQTAASTTVVNKAVPSGWDQSYASPGVIINGNRIDFPAGGPMLVPWLAPRGPTGGPLYFEMTYEGGNYGGGVGVSALSEPKLKTPTARIYPLTSNKSIGAFGPYLLNADQRITEPPAGLTTNSKTIGILVDFIDKGITFTVNGVPSTPMAGFVAHNAPSLADISLLDMPIMPVCIIENTTYQPPGIGFTMTSLPPFKYAVNLPAGTSPWDNPGGSLVAAGATPAPVQVAAGSPYSFSYWRIAIHDNVNHIVTSLQELIFALTPGGASICAGGTPLAQSQFSSYPVANAFDNSPSFWISSANVPPDVWIEYNFGKSVAPREVRLMARPDGYGNAECATSFDVLGSNDGINYTLVSKNTAATWTTSSQVQAFAIPVHP